jgi:hypothetical protein
MILRAGILILCLFEFLLVGAQQIVITIETDGLTRNPRQLELDSIVLGGNTLTKLPNAKNHYYIEERLIGPDSLQMLSIYFEGNEYVIRVERTFLTYCKTIHRISFSIHKRKQFYNLSDCTSLQISGPLKKRKLTELRSKM